jgi:dTMP kinase
MKKGKFVMIDGLDGSGKGTAVNALKENAIDLGKKVLDLREYWETQEGFPNISDYDVIVSAEPTFTHIGKKIRDVMIKNGSIYTPEEIAIAYSEDRFELYNKIIVPAINSGKDVYQERGVITSLVYQPKMKPSYQLEKVMNLPGNKFCLDYPPNLLLITTVDPETAMERLGKRTKKDDAIFEKLEFQKKIQEIYREQWLRDIFESKGTKVSYIDTNKPFTEKDTARKTLEIFKEL